MKLLKYKKFLAILCALIILFVFLTVPASASSTFLDTQFSQPFFTPGNIAFNYFISNYEQPYYFYVSHNYDPIVGDFRNLNFRDDFNGETLFNINQNEYILYAYFRDEFIEFDSARSNLIQDDYGVLSGFASFSFYTSIEFDPNYYADDLYLSSISISDFYCWNNDDLYRLTSETNLFVDNFSDFATISYIDIVYRNVGTSELLSKTFYPSDIASDLPRFLNGDFELRPKDIDGNNMDTAVYYVDSLVIHVSARSFVTDISGYLNYIFYPGLESYDLDQASPTFDDNPAFSLAPYTAWLANAVGGFMDFEIYHNFTIGGIFMTIIAFACCVWFLKLVAGG